MAPRKKKPDYSLCLTCGEKVRCLLCNGTQPVRAIEDNWFHHETNNQTYHCCSVACNDAVHQHENGLPYQ